MRWWLRSRREARRRHFQCYMAGFIRTVTVVGCGVTAWGSGTTFRAGFTQRSVWRLILYEPDLSRPKRLPSTLFYRRAPLELLAMMLALVLIAFLAGGADAEGTCSSDSSDCSVGTDVMMQVASLSRTMAMVPESGETSQRDEEKKEGATLTQNVTIDPDEYNEDPRVLLSVNETIDVTSQSCPPQPAGWHGCAWGRVYNAPAYCAASIRETLNNGQPVNFRGCAFLAAQDSRCSRYFYTTSTSNNAGGVCKCCTKSPSESSKYYGSSSCNYVYWRGLCTIR